MALSYSQILLCRDDIFQRARSQGELLLLHFEHLARERYQFLDGVELIAGLLHPLQALLTSQTAWFFASCSFTCNRRCSSSARWRRPGRCGCEGDVERHSERIVGEVVAEDIVMVGCTDRPAPRVIGGIDIERGNSSLCIAWSTTC